MLLYVLLLASASVTMAAVCLPFTCLRYASNVVLLGYSVVINVQVWSLPGVFVWKSMVSVLQNLSRLYQWF